MAHLCTDDILKYKSQIESVYIHDKFSIENIFSACYASLKRMGKKDKDEDKRKSLRFDCVLPAEVVELKGKQNLIGRATIKDFSNVGLKLTVNFNLEPRSPMDLKLYLPEKRLSTSVSGEISWSKFKDKKLEIGLKIKDMDKKLKKEILDWISPSWTQETKEEKK